MATHLISNVPDRWDLEHLAGTEFYVRVPVLDGAGEPVDPNDILRVRAHIRTAVDGDQILHEFSTELDPVNAFVEDDSGAAVVALSASPAETSDWAITWPGKAGEALAWWDVEVVDTNERPHQIMRPGTIRLIHEVTR